MVDLSSQYWIARRTVFVCLCVVIVLLCIEKVEKEMMIIVVVCHFVVIGSVCGCYSCVKNEK